MTYEYLQTQVERIRKNIKGKGIQFYVDYVIAEHIFETSYPEKFFKDKFNVWFCNGLKYPINRIQLVYSAYEGILSILPVGDHDSYFNSKTIDIVDNEKWDKEVFDLWQKLISL